MEAMNTLIADIEVDLDAPIGGNVAITDHSKHIRRSRSSI